MTLGFFGVGQISGVDVVLAVRTDSAPTPAASSRFVKNCSVPPKARDLIDNPRVDKLTAAILDIT
ncbi:hypothetical protein DPMN_109379 [Dreissena polymorpha]|uniref:Uncharacterized protein n=1 Tax=Dreissena polymorpha TaxID=45954 RepID=A0A9D4QMY0_DREPO|nr:hypothetical protein DPMN_109379 [Dreissena polymorpha]